MAAQREVKKNFPKRMPDPPYRMKWDGRMSGADFEAYRTDPEVRKNWNAYYAYDDMGDQVTKICCILALSRGKLHMTRRRNLDGTVEELTKGDISDCIGSYWHNFVK